MILFRRHHAGEISASNAAYLPGAGSTVAAAFVMTRDVGLPLPRPPRAQEAGLKHALRDLLMFGSQKSKVFQYRR